MLKLKNYKTYAECNELFLSDLARYIQDELFFSGDSSVSAMTALIVAGKVWKDRTGAYPTIGEVRVLAGLARC